MAYIKKSPSIIKSAGNKEKVIKEYFGRVNSNTTEVSIAQMISPEGWEEPGQCPEFDEYTVVLKGKLLVSTKEEVYTISEGEAVMGLKGEWIKYSSPYPGGAEYIAVCLPAFTPLIVHREDENH